VGAQRALSGSGSNAASSRLPGRLPLLVLGSVIGRKLLDSEAEPLSYRETGAMNGAAGSAFQRV